jgi:hypothetical protein
LLILGNEFRVAWLVPKEDLSVIIYPHDVEYIDLCAVQTNPPHNRIFTTARSYGSAREEAADFGSGCITGKLKVSGSTVVVFYVTFDEFSIILHKFPES